MMRVRRSIAMLAVGAKAASILLGCSSESRPTASSDTPSSARSTPTNGSSTPDVGTGDPATDPHALNPDGVPYPKSGFGVQARGVGGTFPGALIRNYHFQGYTFDTSKGAFDTSNGPQTIALADYFDPTAKRYKVIHLSVVASWCDACRIETRRLVPLTSRLASQGVVLLQAVAQGKTYAPSTVKDLDEWIVKEKPNFTQLLDPGMRNLGVFFDTSSLPWNANIDARSMEVLTSDVGLLIAEDEFVESIEAWVNWVNTHPASKING